MNKTIVIGLDGATYTLINKFLNKDIMPNLYDVIKNGVSGNLISTIPISTPSSWSTIITGKNVGKHGLTWFLTRKNNNYHMIPVNSTFRKSKDIWEIISENGKKVCIINIPFTYPPRKVNGYLISGFPFPGKVNNLTYPQSLFNELNKKTGFKQMFIREEYKESKEVQYLSELWQNTKNIMDVSLFMLKNYDWDFFMTVIYEIDQLEHGFWKYFDPEHPKYNKEKALLNSDIINKYFKKIDLFIGEIVNYCNKYSGMNIFIISDHGMESLYKWVHLNNILIKLGYLNIKNDIITKMKYTLYKLGITPLNLYRLLHFFNLGRIRRFGKPGHHHNLLSKIFLSFNDIDWSKTKAFSTPGFGEIFINLEGRDYLGSVKIMDYENLRKTIIKKLQNIKDPENGNKIFKKVLKKEEIYFGNNLDRISDIFVVPHFGYGVFPNYEFGINKFISPSFGPSGGHSINGIVIIKSPIVNKNSEIINANVKDIAPTILYLMNLPISLDMDGRVLVEIINPSYLEEYPIKYVNMNDNVIMEEIIFSEKEQKELEEKLRRLGYL